MIHVIGAGSFATEVAEFCADAGLEVAALVDLDALGPPRSPAERAVIGTGYERRALARRLFELGWELTTVVHPAAHVARSATVGDGTVVAPGAVVGAAVTIGSNTLLSRGVLVGHHTRVGSRVTLNPGTNIAGNCTIGDDVFAGLGATISDHVTVGADAVIAAGAVVLEAVGPGCRVQGVPARPFEP